MRSLAGYIFFLLSTLPLAAQEASWWYPLGNPEATRRVLGMLPSPDVAVQDSTSLLVKWRSTRLFDSPILLVGAIRNEPGSTTVQQVVGMRAGTNELTILSSGGRLLHQSSSFPGVGIDAGTRLSLTGLFNTIAPSPVPFGRPNVIGLGIERTQSTAPEDSLFGVLADSNGSLYRYLPIERLKSSDGFEGNRRAGVYPVAAFRQSGDSVSRAIAIVTQDSYDGSVPDSDTMANSVRRYRLPNTTSEGVLNWVAPFAPKAYEQQPGMLDSRNAGEIFLAPSNSTYRFVPRRDVSPPPVGNQTQTFSNNFYSFNLRIDVPSPNPEVVQTARIPRVEINPGDVLGRADSYFARLYSGATDQTGSNYLITTENHSTVDTGVARIFVYAGTEARLDPVGSYLRDEIRDIGWTIVAADLDGDDNSTVFGTGLFRNKGDEIVGALRRADGADIEANRFYLFRWDGAFTMFASFPFSGRLMAAGDLTSETDRRQELLVANGNTLLIYQLRRYDDADFISPGPSRKPFRLVATIPLSGRIVNAVIADLEGDGLNDIVVTTESATYAIGRPPLLPFGAVTISDTAFCERDLASIRWQRRAGDGELGTDVTLRRGDGFDTTLTNPAGSPDSLLLPPGALQPGRYRVIIRDRALPALVDSSRTFTVLRRSIERFSLADGVQIGDSVLISNVPISCVDSIELQYSYDRTSWTQAEGYMSQTGSRVDAGTVLLCPLQVACGAQSSFTIYYRLTNETETIASPIDSITVTIPGKNLTVSPDTGRSRQRTVRWNPEDFSCDGLRISLEVDGRSRSITTVPRTSGSYDLEIPMELAGEVTISICCALPTEACEFARRTIETEMVEDANFIAPNPFDPQTAPSGARIVYRLMQAGEVDITIYDASRSIVRRLAAGVLQEPGYHGAIFWDGRNERGEIVANGTYICVIESDSGERILLQMIVVKH